MSIFKKIVGMFVCGVVSLALVITFGVNHFVVEGLNAEAVRTLTVKQNAFTARITDMVGIARDASNNIGQRVDIINALLSNDVSSIQKNIQSILKNQNITILTILDSSGKVLARGQNDKSGDVLGSALVQKILQGESVFGIESGLEASLAVIGASPVKVEGKVVGAVIAGFDLGFLDLVDDLKERIDAESTIFVKNTRLATTIVSNGARAIGTVMDNQTVLETVLERKEVFTAQNKILGALYDTVYWPVLSSQGEALGMFFYRPTQNCC